MVRKLKIFFCEVKWALSEMFGAWFIPAVALLFGAVIAISIIGGAIKAAFSP